MKRVAVLTSGGDAPGMNAAIRAVVRLGLDRGWEMVGVRRGYRGLIDGDLVVLGARDVGGIMERGGTVLGTARCPEMATPAGQMQALAQLHEHDLHDLVVIGGEGSQAGAHALSLHGLSVVGVASTIDNDLAGTELTIGATTAIDVALESVDRLRVTASSHRRVFLVEVMGRACGYLAAHVGVASGAEAIVVPELPEDPETVAMEIHAACERGKSHAIVVVAEGARHNAEGLAQYFAQHQARLGFDLRVCRLGHVQRGGAPGVTDRLLATRFGAAAVEQIARGDAGVLVGLRAGEVVTTALRDVVGRPKPLDTALLAMARKLAQ